LEYARIIGFKGVVVHVGKSVGKHPGESIMRMRDNILSVLESASVDCPLLLETPAGQGTETLTGMEEFMDFVASIDDRRFGICVDTCHTFACGHCPLDYIQRCVSASASASASSPLRLVHFNDSKTECGSRKDRHEYIGMGHIGIAKMGDIAELCHSNGIPMVVE
jgi:deoxyribonuclease-4